MIVEADGLKCCKIRVTERSRRGAKGLSDAKLIEAALRNNLVRIVHGQRLDWRHHGYQKVNAPVRKD
jgi:hypothetical protein